jgi:hypothetical protein
MSNPSEDERARILLKAKRLGQLAAIDEALTVLRLARVAVDCSDGKPWFVDLETGSVLREA